MTNIGYRKVFKIGERYQNNCKCWYEIIGYSDDPSKRYIKFDSGYECEALTSQLRNGKIKDFGNTTYYGVANVGMKNASTHPLYWRWFNMIGRCYDKNHCQYKSYGAKGITVSDELLTFKNYVEIVSKLDHYEDLLKNPDKWQIDKDAKSGENKIYSKETLSIITKKENIDLENSGKRIVVDMYDMDENLMATFPSINMAEKVTGVQKANISRTIRGESRTAGGYIWREHNVD